MRINSKDELCAMHYHSKESLNCCLLHIRERHGRGSQDNKEYRTDAKKRDDGLGFAEQAKQGY